MNRTPEQQRAYRAAHPNYQRKEASRLKARREAFSPEEQTAEHERLLKKARNASAFYDQLPVVCDGEADEQGNYRWLAAYDGKRCYTLKQSNISFSEAMYWLQSIAHDLEKQEHGRKVHLYWFSFGYDMDKMLGNEEMALETKYDITKQRSRNYGAVRTADFSKEKILTAKKIAVYAGKKVVDVRFLKSDRHMPDGLARDEHDDVIAWGRLHMEDVWSLTATSFVRTIEKICVPAWDASQRDTLMPLLDMVKSGKSKRGEWEDMTEADILAYNEAELVLLHWYVSHLIAMCKSQDILPRSLAGPAPFARALISKYDAKKHLKPEDYDTVDYQQSTVFTAVRHSYFGGRIEAAGQGRIPAGWHEHDISSAYPYAFSNLPCLAHGKWEPLSGENKLKSPEDVAPYALYHIRWRAVDKASGQFGPFPVRYPDHTIAFPMAGEGWYCSPELQAFLAHKSRHAYLEVIEGYQWIATCECDHPFAWVNDVFEERKKLIAAHDGGEAILKISLNAIYGILAQVAGGYRTITEDGVTVGYHTGPYSNLFAASYITSTVRAMIYRAIMQNNAKVFMVMTDAVYATVPLDLPCPAEKILGTWEHKQHDAAMIVIGPGITASEDGSYSKRRGMEVGLDYADVVEQWENESRVIEQQIKRYASLRDTITTQQGVLSWDKERWGTFHETTRKIDTSPKCIATKRWVWGNMTRPLDFVYYNPRLPSKIPSVIYRRPFDTADETLEQFSALQEKYQRLQDDNYYDT